jgi:hypothetical protein
LQARRSIAALHLPLAGDHEQVLVAVLGGSVRIAGVGARGELEEVAVEGRRPLRLVLEAGANGGDGAEGLREELDVVAWRAQ